MKIQAIKTRIFKAKDNLLSFLDDYFISLKENSILVITSKIVSLSENRIVERTNSTDKEKIIRQESDFSLAAKHAYLTIKDGLVMASAGIDESNADGSIILLPKDSWRRSNQIRRHFINKFSLKNLGVIITDSHTAPLRAGVMGVALAYAGFKGIKDYRHHQDIFGRSFHFSRVDIADSLAASAVLCMGEGDEQQPIALIKEAPVHYLQRVNKKELMISPQEDMYGPLFRYFK